MNGQHRVVRNDYQRDEAIAQITASEYPYQLKVSDIASPKTVKQIRYAHSLCGALSIGKQVSPDVAKRDAKAAFGVITVCTSVITGDRTARLKSFADYTCDEMTAFVSAMEAFLDQNRIPFTRAKP